MILIFRQTGNNNTIVTTGVIVDVFVVVVGVQESHPTANVSGAICACAIRRRMIRQTRPCTSFTVGDHHHHSSQHTHTPTWVREVSYIGIIFYLWRHSIRLHTQIITKYIYIVSPTAARREMRAIDKTTTQNLNAKQAGRREHRQKSLGLSVAELDL